MKCLTACLAMLVMCLALLGASLGQLRKRQTTFDLSCQTDKKANGTCCPFAACPTYSSDDKLYSENLCPLDTSNTQGVCCPNVPLLATESSAVDPALVSVFAVSPETISLPEDEISDSTTNAMENVERVEKLEKTLATQGKVVKPNTAEDVHNRVTFGDEEAQELGKQGILASEISKDVSSKLQLNSTNAYSELQQISLANSPIADTCPQEPTCNATKYRSYDGSCNNLKHSNWGKASRAFRRMSAPTYADGVSKPRIAYNGGELPSCRLVSTTIIHDQNREFPNIDSMFMSFGQFLDHDLSLTPTTRGANGSGILCCPPVIQPQFRHPECMEIAIPKNDPFYSQFNQTCMEFVRTIPAPPPKCTLGPREQINLLTNFVDCSQIYGSSEAQALNLRDTYGGRLRIGGGTPGREFPPNRNGGGCVGNVSAALYCIDAGDSRANEQPVVAVLHTAFLREHNRISAELAKLNPGWNDEMLYQETRRILQAEMQNIVYNEFVPLVLGKEMIKRFDLELKKRGYFNKYNASLDPTISNEFATAGFRFGHSLVQAYLLLVAKKGHGTSELLRNNFLKPFQSSLMDNYIRGATTQASQLVDENLTGELTNHLFQRNNKFGLDLASFNCQRGRDHSIGTYNQLRKVCGLKPVTSFKDLEKHMDKNTAKKFPLVYKNVNDIDLWVGGVSEKPMSGAAVGPTFGCIIGDQFKRLRLGDRLWFERGNTGSSFSEAQLDQIRKASLARILCDNTDIKEIQPLALLRISKWNVKVSCDSSAIAKVTFRPWKK